MADDASTTAHLTPEHALCLREAVESGEYANEQEALEDALSAWRLERAPERPGLAAFLDHRHRLALEDEANGRLIPHEQVFAELREIVAARLRGETLE